MNRVGVEPELLRWARERSGRGADYLQKRFPQLEAWERGSVLPTFKQLEAFARATYAPIGYLFLREPPARYGDASDEDVASTLGKTTLDRVHTAMLLQSGGHAYALRALIGTEQDRGPEFLRLANALSALYPLGSNEKRLLDAMLLAVPK